MMRPLPLLAALLLVASALPAQQTGDANRDYVINGNGAGGTSPVMTSLGVPGTSLDNDYTTSDPGAPVVWIYATNSLINWVPGLVANSVDIGPTGLAFLLDGISPGPLSPLLITSPTGTFGIELFPSASLAGSSFDLAMAHLSATSPEGLYLSQTHRVSFFSDPNLSFAAGGCNPMATPVSLSDDSSSAQVIGFPFTFYGVAYSQCYVGSNGHITFTNGNSGWASGDLSNYQNPIIATLSEDLNPGSGGTVTFYTDNTSTFEVCFTSRALLSPRPAPTPSRPPASAARPSSWTTSASRSRTAPSACRRAPAPGRARCRSTSASAARPSPRTRPRGRTSAPSPRRRTPTT